MPRPLVGDDAIRAALTAGILLTALVVAGCGEEPAATPPMPAPGTPDQPSGFDFWVLSLSWSPSYCAIEGEEANRQQCGSGRKLGFVVHGLWPQFEAGWPEFCDSDEPARVPDALVRDYLDIMPSAGLIGHQWRKHGTCSGLSQRDYLAAARTARERVVVPTEFAAPRADLAIDPDRVEAAFIASNEGLPGGGIAVTCDGGFIEEVRICLTTELGFRPCEEVDARACRASSARMPAP